MQNHTPKKILRVDASMRTQGSVSRALADTLIERWSEQGAVDIKRHDLAAGVDIITQSWIAANFTPEEERSDENKSALETSDRLVDDLKSADTLVIATPVYNFSLPAALKAWIDQVVRARTTFRYTDEGPEGLLAGKKAFVVYASGGTPMGSPIDFVTPYLKHVLGFIGIKDVTFLDKDTMAETEEKKAS